MREIENLKKKYTDILLKRYYNRSSKIEDLLSKCNIQAEIWAYISSILPINEIKDISKYTIFDFDGYIVDKKTKERRNVITEDVCLRAKNIICEYCWGKSWIEVKKEFKQDDKIKEVFKHSSVMSQRRENGNNIIIFGESDFPLGRTLLASVVMKEAIKLRADNRYKSHTYDWVDFSSLKNSLIKDTPEASIYRSCDWLVIDNIQRPDFATIQQKAFINEIIDGFFMDRMRDNLPIILVFKFDIKDEYFNIEKEMGIGISKIVSNSKTFVVSLC